VSSSQLGRRGLLQASSATIVSSLVGCKEDNRPPLWFSYGGKNREELLKLVDEFNKLEPAHALKPVFQGDYFELLAKLRTALSAGRAPAVTHVIAEVVPYLVQANVLADLSPMLEGDLELVPQLSEVGTYSGKRQPGTFGLPFNRSTPIAYFNGNQLKELGLSSPTTWSELRTFAQAATSSTSSGTRYGFACPVDWWFWVALVYQAGGELCDQEGRFTLGGEAGVEALALWQALVHEDKTMRPPSGRDYTAWGNINQEFLAGRFAMIWNSSAFLRYLETNASFPVIAAPLPAKLTTGVPSGGTMFVVPNSCPPEWREGVGRFLRFMMSPRCSNQFATNTGYIPVTRPGIQTLQEAGHYKRFPNDAIAIGQLEAVRPWPWSKKLFRVQREVMQSRLEAAVLNNEHPAQAMKAAIQAVAVET
jgi:sn-glycerol 3-phosphate transport system substrate-binding protein